MRVHLKLAAAATLWGGTFVCGRIVAPHLGPLSTSFLRFFVASACLLWLLLRHEGGLPRMSPRTLAGVGLLGLTGVFAYNIFFFNGLQTVPAGRAAAIIAANPVVIALGAALFLGERLTAPRGLGIALSVSGAVFILSHGAPLELLAHGVGRGDLFILGCVASWSAYSLLGKLVMGRLSALASVALSCCAGTLFLLPGALAEGLAGDLGRIGPPVWGCILYLGLLGTVAGFTWFYEGVRAIGAARAAVFINLVPVSAALSGLLLLGEPVDSGLALGAAMVLGGVWLTNRA
ncbi:DMT family transporter [Desulfocurvus sp.]|jgi:drug/metabolite transporter (DMT)-like permease|uniref:DMT family transporter n=1 Tax=Desulfocurvus sp. TaxID=2871698 RepID=UPI0025C2F290|nr:DMT family transporter [Desulfocurvus sp.]MCK9240024.1 DMT family transporter [Desulfocurvus sp.]